MNDCFYHNKLVKIHFNFSICILEIINFEMPIFRLFRCFQSGHFIPSIFDCRHFDYRGVSTRSLLKRYLNMYFVLTIWKVFKKRILYKTGENLVKINSKYSNSLGGNHKLFWILSLWLTSALSWDRYNQG